MNLKKLFSAAALSGVLMLPALRASAPVDARFGVMTHFAHGWDHDWAWIAAMRSISTVRDELYWNSVEPQKGVYIFPAAYDDYMDTLRVAGISPLVVLSFANSNYDGGATPYSTEAMTAYGRYGVEVLRHYGDQIKAVEIWNEYNGGFCTGPATENRALTYTQMLATAYTQIKAERPDVTVLGGATIGTPAPYWEKLMQAGALTSMDALSVHPYRYNTAPEGIETDITALQALVKKYNNGQPKPIWVTEVGWGIQDGTVSGQLAIDEATQAKFLVRAYTLLLSAGVERVYWYLLRDDEDFTLGLTKSDATPKQSAYAMQVLINELAGARFVKREPSLDQLYSLLFARSDGTEVRVIWSLAPVTLAVSGLTGVTDMVGNTHAVSDQLTLSDVPIYVEGPLHGLPAPVATTETLLTDSVRDFSCTQQANGWSYGDFVGNNGAFEALTNYVVTDWTQVWGGAYPYLTVSTVDQHPSAQNNQAVSAVRRWTSTAEGSVHLVGQFQCGAGGDGVGVSILVDGLRLFRTPLGGGNAIQAPFDFVQVVHAGTHIDFAVDPGPGLDIDFDATTVHVTISTLP